MKTLIILALVIFSTLNNFAQIVDIPDINFKNALIEDGIDTNNDGEIQVSEAEVILNLNVSSENIFSLEGIQSFINLELLICTNNQLSDLDVSQNLNLKNLWCGGNQLSDLDVSQNVNLNSLWCSNNQFSNLDVSQNTNLKSLSCGDNQLSNLDVTQNPILEELECSNNQLISLHINNGNNHNMYNMHSFGNINLTCIQIDDENATYPVCMEFPITGWCIDDWSSYSEDCVLGITEQSLAASLQLYPNPVQDVLHINTQNGVELKQIQVYDVMGKKVLEGKSASLDFTGLASGLYFVKVETNQGVLVKRVMRE